MASTHVPGRKPPNLIWFVVDSVRNYQSGGDDRDKLDIMYKVAKECVDFETAVTSAPSTVMSGSAMMTGCDAYLIGRDYDNFSYDRSAFTSMGEVLRSRGYDTTGIMWFLHSRQRLGGKVIDLADRRYWPKGLKFGRNWDNDEVSFILNRRLDDEMPEPFFLLVWYNCRGDPQTSAKVERDLGRLRDMGLMDNSVFVMGSDHGYPDPSRGMGPQWFARQNLTHDLVLTDDNILVPLMIQYPGCTPRTVTVPVCTIDLMPTILELMDIQLSTEEAKGVQGKSLVPLMQGEPAPLLEDRKFRSDARFMMQTQRRTAIRGTRYKYIRYHDEGTDEFYDLQEDPSESRSVIDDPSLASTVAEYKAEFERTEQRAVDHHMRYLLERSRVLDTRTEAVRTVLVICSQPLPNSKALLGALSSLPEVDRADLLAAENGLPDEDTRGFANVVQWRASPGGSLSPDPSLPDQQYDLVVVPTLERKSAGYQAAIKLGRRLSKREPMIVDPNMNSVTRPKRTLGFMLKVAYRRRGLYLREPGLALRDIKLAANGILARAAAARQNG